MKLIYFVLITILFSCNHAADSNEEAAVPAVPPKVVQPEDSVTKLLRAVITDVEKKELQQVNPVKWMFIDSIKHEMISMKDYYNIQKEQLSKSFHLSTDKEKTTRALVYLDMITKKAPSLLNVYKVQFHLNALLTNTTKYNESHTKYLKEDLSEIKIVFP